MYICDLLAVGRRRQRDHPKHARAHPLGEGLDGAALAGGVASLEHDHGAQALVLHPILQVAELDLELAQLLLVVLALELSVDLSVFSTSAFMDASSCGRGAPGRAIAGLAARSCASPWSLVDDVIAAVDIERFAGDQPRRVVRQEGGGDADVVDADQARARAPSPAPCRAARRTPECRRRRASPAGPARWRGRGCPWGRARPRCSAPRFPAPPWRRP